MQLQEAQKIAVDICYKLQPYCDKINIAGSIRRKKPEVKDIEIVALPKQVEVVTPDLFGDGEKMVITDLDFATKVNELGKILKGHPTGRYMAIELPQGINLDLFMPEPNDFIRQYVIRTGSASYVSQNIAWGWKRKGWCGSDKGLRLIKDCIEQKLPDGKSKWKCIKSNPELPPVWNDEKEFFTWLNIPFLEPQNRL